MLALHQPTRYYTHTHAKYGGCLGNNSAPEPLPPAHNQPHLRNERVCGRRYWGQIEPPLKFTTEAGTINLYLTLTFSLWGTAVNLPSQRNRRDTGILN